MTPKPRRYRKLCCAILIASMLAGADRVIAADPPEPFLKNLPAGVYLKKAILADDATNRRLSRNLGGEIQKLSNSNLIVQGRAIQVNGITAVDERAAIAIHNKLKQNKPYPFTLRRGNQVIEFVANNLDAAIAHKTSFELGLAPKPKKLRYRVTAEVATVDKADYMACNPLFNQFLRHRQQPSNTTTQELARLAERFTFGRQLRLRRAPKRASYQFQPSPTSNLTEESTTAFQFDQPKDRNGVSFVTATMLIETTGDGMTPTNAPSARMIAATERWPADDPEIKSIAQQITRGKTTNQEKVEAILLWLWPGRNIKYSGQTGSRWGTSKVFQQKFGHCWDFSDCFVTLCRSAGVPSRQVAGWLYGSSGHVWAEYYQEGKGWRQVDPTGGGKLPCGIYHIPYFTSDDGEMPIVYLSMPKIEIVRN